MTLLDTRPDVHYRQTLFGELNRVGRRKLGLSGYPGRCLGMTEKAESQTLTALLIWAQQPPPHSLRAPSIPYGDISEKYNDCVIV
jgi:hypothetical protein